MRSYGRQVEYQRPFKYWWQQCSFLSVKGLRITVLVSSKGSTVRFFKGSVLGGRFESITVVKLFNGATGVLKIQSQFFNKILSQQARSLRYRTYQEVLWQVKEELPAISSQLRYEKVSLVHRGRIIRFLHAEANLNAINKTVLLTLIKMHHQAIQSC